MEGFEGLTHRLFTFSHTLSSSPFDIMYRHVTFTFLKRVAQSGLSFLRQGGVELQFFVFWGGSFSPRLGWKLSYYFSAFGKNCCITANGEYVTADQLNTVFKKDRREKKNTSTVLRTLTRTVYTKPSFHSKTSLNPAALLAHTQRITPAFYWTAQQGVNLVTLTCRRFIEMPANLSGSVLGD